MKIHIFERSFEEEGIEMETKRGYRLPGFLRKYQRASQPPPPRTALAAVLRTTGAHSNVSVDDSRLFL